MITIDISTLYDESPAKLNCLDGYKQQALELAGEGNPVTLTGAGPIWLYLAIAHELHGKASSLTYDSPASGKVRIFDHNPH